MTTLSFVIVRGKNMVPLVNDAVNLVLYTEENNLTPSHTISKHGLNIII